MSGRDSVTGAQRKAVMDAFLRRQADQQAREAKEAAEVEAIYRKALAAGEKPPTPRAIREAVAARDAAAAEAERERDGAAARRIVDGSEPDPVPEPVAPIGNEYLSLAEIEAQRRKLAREGRSHGYKMLVAWFGKGARSTIRRRYKGLPPPGSPIPGVCQKAPPQKRSTRTTARTVAARSAWRPSARRQTPARDEPWSEPQELDKVLLAHDLDRLPALT
jgi:hypothetical protein